MQLLLVIYRGVGFRGYPAIYLSKLGKRCLKRLADGFDAVTESLYFEGVFVLFLTYNVLLEKKICSCLDALRGKLVCSCKGFFRTSIQLFISHWSKYRLVPFMEERQKKRKSNRPFQLKNCQTCRCKLCSMWPCVLVVSSQ